MIFFKEPTDLQDTDGVYFNNLGLLPIRHPNKVPSIWLEVGKSLSRGVFLEGSSGSRPNISFTLSFWQFENIC